MFSKVVYFLMYEAGQPSELEEIGKRKEQDTTAYLGRFVIGRFYIEFGETIVKRLMLNDSLSTGVNGGKMNVILTESLKYCISFEFEKAYLVNKRLNTRIELGELYGDPQAALISQDESFCAVGGCGLLIYYFDKPFDMGEQGPKPNLRTVSEINGVTIWVATIAQIDRNTICLSLDGEQDKRIVMDIHTLQVHDSE